MKEEIKNHDIRFKVSKGEKEAIDNLWKEIGSDFKKNAFYKRLLLKGFEKVFDELKGQGKKAEEIIRNLFTKK